MIRYRFLCKTNKQGITTIFVVVVMLLLFTASCGSDVKEVVTNKFDPETSFTMRTTDAIQLISDSGFTRYRVIAKDWLMYEKAKEPYWYFPEGAYVEKFDTLFQTEFTLKADTAYNYRKKRLWKLIGHVKAESIEGKTFETSLLYLDEENQKFYSDQYIRIVEADKIITGIGFESNQDMTQYKIFNSTGTFPLNEAPADSFQISTPDSVAIKPEEVQIDTTKVRSR